MANKNLTIAEVEEMRSAMTTAIAEAITAFESETGIRTGYIDIVRKRDVEGRGMNEMPIMTDSMDDAGDVVAINIDIRGF